MSNHLAIATVTATLGQIALSAVESAVSGAVQIRFGRPSPDAQEVRKLHVYLYQVTPNAALRNEDLCTRDSAGRLINRPRTALDLHYLLSFYGDEKELEPDRMLGAVVRDLHARPVPSREFIQNVIGSRAELNESDLAHAPEAIKFTPGQLSLEDLSRIWSVMVQSPHVVSVPYLATVVLIDALEGGPAALPVLRRGEQDQGIETRLGPFPQLKGWWAGAEDSSARVPRVPSYPAAQLGARLIMSGANLGADELVLRFTHASLANEQQIVVPSTDRSANELRLTLPEDDAAQDAWPAGAYSASVSVKRGDSALTSGILPILLAPRITAIQPNSVNGAGTDITFTINCRPKIRPKQRVTLLIGNREVVADARTDPTDSLSFTVTAAHLLANEVVRIRVDGVDSFPVRYDSATRRFVFDDAQRVTIT